MRSLILASLFVCFSGALFSQLDNTTLYYNTVVDTSHEKTLFVKIQNLNFMKDNEYSNAMVDGYTLFGFQFNPQLGLQISKNLSIEGGIFLSKDFGNKNFTQISPTFSLRYYKKDFKMIFGNLDGSLNHGLIEPLYNFERVISSRLENGAQFILNKKHFDFDVWVDWLNMIYKTSESKEKLMSGINATVLKLENEQWLFKLPFQGTVIHNGGQLDTADRSSSTDFNYAAGIILNRKLNRKYLKNIYLDARYVLRSHNYFNSPISFHSWGDGFLGNVAITGAYKTNVMLSFWYGDSYYNELGGDLYSSKSRTVAYSWYWTERIRELMILRLTKTIALAKGVNFMLRIEPYYDLRNKQLESAFGFYISIDERVWLKNKLDF